MTGDSLAALRDQAVSGIEDLVDVLALGATLGARTAGEDDVHRPFRRVGSFDVAGLAADSRRLDAAHRAVAEQLHRLPEQQVRLGRGWVSESGARAVAAVVDHQRRAEADLHVLRTLAEATGSAASGIDQLLRTWYLTVAQLAAPLVAGVPLAAVPGAIVAGRLPAAVVIDDIASRAALYFTTAHATASGIDEILEHLDRVTEGMDVEPYPLAGSRPTEAQRPAQETTATPEQADTTSGQAAAGGEAAGENVPVPSRPGPDVPLQLTPDHAAHPPQPQAPESANPPAEDAALAPMTSAPEPGAAAPPRPQTHGPPPPSAGDLALAGDE
ncbi:hypothetical protein [Gordonia hankookensis]|uniref:DUF222 domain-containing protein n=1 Tax=Gordonia hankookensis TaxID=589403 RepID=A0ABR7WE12_9ACTN|nr:hypothetical protein [Gordonia hankookensis]MBD1321022.1 hypothetical protein [Gordonia hankookensis]